MARQADAAEWRRICHTSRQSWLAHWKNERGAREVMAIDKHDEAGEQLILV
jgi:hypothetical protein